jgi:hypothetical protein
MRAFQKKRADMWATRVREKTQRATEQASGQMKSGAESSRARSDGQKKRVTGSNESHGQNIAFLNKKNERKIRTADRWKKKQI